MRMEAELMRASIEKGFEFDVTEDFLSCVDLAGHGAVTAVLDEHHVTSTSPFPSPRVAAGEGHVPHPGWCVVGCARVRGASHIIV